MTPEEFFKQHPSLREKVIQPLYLAAQAKEFAENEHSSFPVVHIQDVARTQTDNAIIKEKVTSLLCYIVAANNLHSREDVDRYVDVFFKTLETSIPRVVRVDDLKRAIKKARETDFVAPTNLSPAKMVRVDNTAVLDLIEDELGLGGDK